MKRAWPLTVLLALAAPAPFPRAQANECPVALAHAERLILVTASTMTETPATLTSYERTTERGWRMITPPEPAVVGTAGLGWAWPFATIAASDEPTKREGDNRTPAGIFQIDRPFGHEPSPLQGYLQLHPAETFCVDDLTSAHYNQIVTRETAGATTRGEDMATIDLYRRGLVIDYPTSREKHGGSCIFLHVWQAPGVGTSGCVAGDEQSIARLQGWASEKPTAIVILPVSALKRFGSCLPALPDTPERQK